MPPLDKGKPNMKESSDSDDMIDDYKTETSEDLQTRNFHSQNSELYKQRKELLFQLM